MAKRLIIVAAPSCCGKTTFLKQLYRGELPEVASRCRFGAGKDWKYGDIWLEEETLLHQTADPSRQFLLHYTLPFRGINASLFRRNYDKPNRLKILSSTDDTVVLTLEASSAELLRRVDLRASRMEEIYRVEGKMRSAAYLKARWTLRELRSLYKDPARLAETYANWSAFLSTIGAAQIRVDVNDAPRIEEASPGRDLEKSSA
jgi:hypothetical protein